MQKQAAEETKPSVSLSYEGSGPVSHRVIQKDPERRTKNNGISLSVAESVSVS